MKKPNSVISEGCFQELSHYRCRTGSVQFPLSGLSIHPPTRIGRYHFGWRFAPPAIYVNIHYYINVLESQCLCSLSGL